MNRTRIMSTLNEGQHTFLVISRSLVLRMKNASDKICRENQDTHLMFSNIFFFFENLAIYEVMWKNTFGPDRPQMKIWRMRISCCIIKTTDTHSEYVILIAFPLQQWLYERASVLRYTYVVCLVCVTKRVQHCQYTAYMQTG